MTSLNQKIDYLIRSIVNINQERRCPFCGSNQLTKVDGKYIFTSLLKCEVCKLEHRHPKDNVEWLKKFYQSAYSIQTHMMTKLPADDELEVLKRENFPNQRSYNDYIKALFKQEKGVKIIDYGCSWGYDVYRYLKDGHNAVGFELSVPRASFGKSKLGVPIISDENDLPSNNDLILSSHVIEHLSSIPDFISLSKKLLKPEGIFMAFCPNGSEAYKKREPWIWHINWGAVHPNSLSIEFAQYAFRNNPYLILTGDWVYDSNTMAAWDGRSQTIGNYHEGKELLIISKPNIQLK